MISSLFIFISRYCIDTALYLPSIASLDVTGDFDATYGTIPATIVDQKGKFEWLYPGSDAHFQPGKWELYMEDTVGCKCMSTGTGFLVLNGDGKIVEDTVISEDFHECLDCMMQRLQTEHDGSAKWV